jgi:hypothetical protein
VRLLVKQFQDEDDYAGDCWHFRPGSPTVTMLLVFQTERQRYLLRKYGGSVVMLDATYKTTMWNMPLFVLHVVDNHGHGQPVAFFFIQYETQDAIAEALRW